MIYEPAFADQARLMCRLGATDEELAEHFEVSVRTIYRWRNTHEAFAEAVVAGKDHADARVERALYSRAVGCTVERTRVFKSAGDPDPVYATYQHHLPPDPTAALQWLRVRQPEKWRIRDEPEKEDSLGDIIEEAFARVGKRDRLADEARLSDPPPPPPPAPPQPSPPPEESPPVAPPEPGPEPAPAMETKPAPARPPVPVQPDPGPGPATASAPAPVPRPPLFERFSRNGGGYSWSPPDAGG